MLSRRQRRLTFWCEHGWIWPGWTPPDPNNPRTRSEAVALLRYHQEGAERRAQRNRGAPDWAVLRALRRMKRLNNSPTPAKRIEPRMRALDRILAEYLGAAGW